MHYDPDSEIIVTVGSIEAIAAALLALIEPGDEVLVFSPSYASYLPAIQIAGGEARFVALDEDANFDLDPEAIRKAISKRTRALLICNPNNPTGTVFSKQQTQRMLALAEEHDLLVISDEVYKDFVYTSRGIYSPTMEPSARDRVIRVCSFSKTYGMTGWRVGFLHSSSARVTEILPVHDALVTCAPVVSQYAALAALEVGEAAVAEFRAEFQRRRNRVIERLDALPNVFDYQKPNASYFVFPRVKDTVPHARDSRRLAEELLERARVAVVPGVAFGPTGEAHLRLCYARALDDIDRAFDRMESFFSGRPTRVVFDVTARPVPPAPSERDPVRAAGIALLRAFARAYLRRVRPRVVAITGSQGKTVLKRALEELLGKQFRVRANPLSYNTQVGLPLGVLGCELDLREPTRVAWGFLSSAWKSLIANDKTEVLILELGVRRRGDVRSHLEIVDPDITVVTNLHPSFSEDHEGLAVLRDEVAELCETMQRRNRKVLLSRDDVALNELAARLPGTESFGRADVDEGGGALHLLDGGERLPVKKDVVGASSLYALIVAVRVARWLGVDPERVREFLES
jgi:aminotransferase